MDYKEYMNSCRSCWWQEGGLCYEGELEGKFVRTAEGKSPILAKEKCDNYFNKRKFWEQFLIPETIIITSEERTKTKTKTETK